MKRVLLFAAGLLLAGAGAAETVYRCGTDGRTYAQAPCPGGVPFTASDPRTADQHRKAVEKARAESRHADHLARERAARERQARPGHAVRIDGRPLPREETAATGPKARRKKAKDRQASPPASVFKAQAPAADTDRPRRKTR